MKKTLLSLLLVCAATSVSAAPIKNLTPFDKVWHCAGIGSMVSDSIIDLVAVSIVEKKIPFSQDSARQVYAVNASLFVTDVERLEYETTPQTPLYSAAYAKVLIQQFAPYVANNYKALVEQEADKVKDAVLKECVNTNL